MFDCEAQVMQTMAKEAGDAGKGIVQCSEDKSRYLPGG